MMLLVLLPWPVGVGDAAFLADRGSCSLTFPFPFPLILFTVALLLLLLLFKALLLHSTTFRFFMLFIAR